MLKSSDRGMIVSLVGDFVLRAIGRVRTKPLRAIPHVEYQRALFVCGFPASGNTWMCYLLSHSLQARFINGDRPRGEMHPDRAPLAALLGGSDARRSGLDAVVKTHAGPSGVPPAGVSAILYVVRDGRDAVNSYILRRERAPGSGLTAFLARLWVRLLPFRIRYTLGLRYFAALWARHVLAAVESDARVVRYEDLLGNPVETIIAALRDVGVDVDTTEVAAAVELFSLERMRAAAQDSGTGNVTDRVGRSGDWREHFTAGDRAWFERRYGPLLKKLRYES
jgi:hypothetical protein